MRSYAQYCPVAKATEILGDRWTLLIVREMLGGASGFNELQRGLPGISRSVLTDRMRALERAEVIERRTGPKGRTLEYRLTPAGRDLQPVVQAIGEWGATWSFTEPRPEELDPDLLIVWMARHVDRQRLPPNRTVVQFDFRDPKRRYWMVLEPSEVSVCLQHPGFDVDLEVIVDTDHALPRLLGTGRAGRRDSSRPADDERPADAATRIRPLVHLERIRPSQPLGAGAPHSRLTPCQPSSRTTGSSDGLKSRPRCSNAIADPLQKRKDLRQEGLSVVVTAIAGARSVSRYHRTRIRERTTLPA